MPKFNDNQPDIRFHSARKLLQTLGPLIPSDPNSPEHRAMSELWARLVEKRTTFTRRVPTGRYRKNTDRQIAEAVAAEFDRRKRLANELAKPELDDDGNRLADIPEIPAEVLERSQRELGEALERKRIEREQMIANQPKFGPPK